MSIPISKHGFGPWMKNAAETAVYFYWENVHLHLGEEAFMHGRRSRTGALVEGDVYTFLAGGLASGEVSDMFKPDVFEIDADAGSPYLGCLRWKFDITTNP